MERVGFGTVNPKSGMIQVDILPNQLATLILPGGAERSDGSGHSSPQLAVRSAVHILDSTADSVHRIQQQTTDFSL